MRGRLMDASNFDAAELDEGIRDVVISMRNAGFDTWASCQGGKGHPHQYPVVFLWARGSCEKEHYLLSKWLFTTNRRWRWTKITTMGSPKYTGRRLMKLEMVEMVSSKEANEAREFEAEV